jgi:hypothetical protein
VIPRLLAPRLRALLDEFPAVALLGPRQSGKTTLAHLLAAELGDSALYLDLELPSDAAKLSDAELYFSSHEDRLLILDEIHRVPGLFQVLRGVIDKRRRHGRRSQQFLLLGSASIDLLKQSSESLAGRIVHVELPPLVAAEAAPSGGRALDRLWNRGGFPESFLATNDRASFAWRTAFIRTYLERDLPLLGPRLPGETLKRFWQMLANEQGQMLNLARLASGLGVSGQTVARYLDTLVDLLLVRRLQPWAGNVGKRLVRSPKTYVRDSGVAHALLGIETREELLGHPVVGPSWEGFVMENLLASIAESGQAYFYRTAAGAEIDLLLDLGAKGRWAFKIKRSLTPRPAKGFHLACEDVGASRRIVLYPGAESYPLDPYTEVMPVTKALRGELLSLL